MDNILTKTTIVKMRLLELFFFGDENHFYKLNDVAEELSVNINTVKQVFSEMKKMGYFVSLRGKGFKINKEMFNKKNNFHIFLNEISKIVSKMKGGGFFNDELLFAFYNAINRDVETDIYYVDEDYLNLYVGRRELEEYLGVEIQPILISEALKRLEEGYLEEGLLITTYYCLKRLENYANSVIKIFPLKITPPIDSLINFSKVSLSDTILVITINEEMKKRFENSYHALKRKYKNLIFVTLDDISEKKELINKAKYVLTLKHLYESNQKLFSKVKNLIVYSRFHDDDGINMLIDIVKDNRRS
ncbi:hypothetical protein FHQ18_10500 [Deferribacter autotrophicus]|uniref:GntR family transcriptional regulator n=1 Tax=Deferribacter autotrophicus TaxID=500465 RepID=A0A5A8F3D4_9BACT|nr:hypothetical protein [Deferribacter autotrophicus]KAA0256994.1 hypothetical protein FHQ18_10500 [Deferribacter autotrophicus]